MQTRDIVAGDWVYSSDEWWKVVTVLGDYLIDEAGQKEAVDCVLKHRPCESGLKLGDLVIAKVGDDEVTFVLEERHFKAKHNMRPDDWGRLVKPVEAVDWARPAHLAGRNRQAVEI